jgi:uncharacterized protein
MDAFTLALIAAALIGVALFVWGHIKKRQRARTAIRTLHLMAEANLAEAQFVLGVMYRQGQGYKQAMSISMLQGYGQDTIWYRKAAELVGYDGAQSDLGVPQDYVEAVAWYHKAAEQGHAMAQYHLGQMYAWGKGVPRDDAQAARWYRKAAKQGVAKAQLNLGWSYCLGSGVPQDDRQVARWYHKAAEQGDAEAQARIGVMYERGEGVPQDDAQAAHWYRKAAEQGDAMAQVNLGMLYYDGRGVPQDYKRALAWTREAAAKEHWVALDCFRKAAAQGNALAQYNLGWMYCNGRGVSQNHEKAYVWFSLAAAQGLRDAVEGRDAVASLLTPEALERAKARAAAERGRIHGGLDMAP